jgi:hypothetical protein
MHLSLTRPRLSSPCAPLLLLLPYPPEQMNGCFLHQNSNVGIRPVLKPIRSDYYLKIGETLFTRIRYSI